MTGCSANGRQRTERKGARGRPQDRKGALRQTAADARRLAQEIGTSIWSATDPDDLADLLDASLDDPNIAQFSAKVSGALFRCELGELADFPSFARAIHGKANDNLVADLLEGMRVVSIISGLFRKDGSAQRTSRAANVGPDAWDELDLYSLPGPMLESALAGIRSLICLAALVDLGLFDRWPPAWLIKNVVRGWVDGNRMFLRMLAMFSGDENVPEDLLPEAQRLDQGRLIQEHNQGEIIFEQFMAGAIAIQ